jgi:hypothetical protein
MQIKFTVGEDPAEFVRSPTTGKAELKLGESTVELQDPMKFSTHFTFKKTTSWTAQPAGHEVTIAVKRPLWVAGFRKSTYTVSVDGAVVAEATGH